MLIDRIPVRIRLSIGHAVWLAVIFVGLGVGVYRVVESSIHESLDATLMASARTIRDASLNRKQRQVRVRNSPFWRSILDEFYNGQRLTIRSYAQLVDLSGRVSAKTANTRVRLPVTPLALARAERGLETYETFPSKDPDASPHLRQVTLPIFNRGHFTGELIQVGAPMDTSLLTINRVKNMLIITLSIGFFTAILMGYLLARWAFQPVQRITKAAAGLGVNDLDTRLKPPPAKDELRILVETFNSMLDRLEDAFGRLRRFAGDVSHELRTPLAVLKGEAELALRRERSPEQYREALKVIENESAGMSRIVENLLLLARAEGHALRLEWEPVNTADYLDHLVREVDPVCRQKGVTLRVENQAGNQLNCSPAYLTIAVKNILLNAIKHSQPGAAVDLRVKSTIRTTEIAVRDYGEGIAAGDIPYVFDAFFRADNARNRKAGGAGIGLSLAQALVKLHGGTIAVESEQGEGALFTITIPGEDSDFIESKDRSKATLPKSGLVQNP